MPMNRLPKYDSGTRWAELGAFLSLGLLAAVLVGLTAHDAGRFAQNRDTIIATLSTGEPANAMVAGFNTNRALTNLTSAPVPTRGAHAS